jgi:hypothetical protein
MGIEISFMTFRRNSGERLGFLLENMKVVMDKMTVVDGHSDGAVEIAKSYGGQGVLEEALGLRQPRQDVRPQKDEPRLCSLLGRQALGRGLKSELRGSSRPRRRATQPSA